MIFYILFFKTYNSPKPNVGCLVFGQLVERHYYLFIKIPPPQLNLIFMQFFGNAKHAQFQYYRSVE
jgi:hypothetical protein